MLRTAIIRRMECAVIDSSNGLCPYGRPKPMRQMPKTRRRPVLSVILPLAWYGVPFNISPSLAKPSHTFRHGYELSLGIPHKLSSVLNRAVTCPRTRAFAGKYGLYPEK